MTSIGLTNDIKLYDSILENRTFLMGIAMIIVLIYHLFCWVYNPIGIFNIGYVGVDIFLFLSGLGLALSYKKNGIKKFYLNRFKRIYPLYFIAVTITFFFTKWDSVDLINNYLTLGFYVDWGARRYDWYLESLFTFYLLFPLAYYICQKMPKLLAFILLILTTSILLFSFNVPWWYDCFVGRWPIFILGMLFKDLISYIKPLCILGILLYFPVRYISVFLAASFITLPLIILCLLTLKHTADFIKKCINYFGKYSLEILCANNLTYCAMRSFCDNTISLLVGYFVFQIIFTILFIAINKIIQRCLIKKPIA